MTPTLAAVRAAQAQPQTLGRWQANQAPLVWMQIGKMPWKVKSLHIYFHKDCTKFL